MTIMLTDPNNASYARDPVFPWLLSIKKALDNKAFGGDPNNLLLDCIRTFKHNAQYRNDPRFLKIWLLHLEGSDDTKFVFKEMEENKICCDHSLLYELNTKPLERLKGAHALFLDRISHWVNGCSLQKIDGDEPIGLVKNRVHPWSGSTMEELLKKIHTQIMRYDGYHQRNKAYSGKVDLLSLGNASRNKIVKISGKEYQIKGCAGDGDYNPDDIVALKIQKPAFPWEFYMYRQLDQRISTKQRSSFGVAHGMDVHSDYSLLVCDYLCHGTLHDVINSYVIVGKSMEEVLCIYYTTEMLYVLETLHDVGIIHGDFKPDDLLVRYSRDDLSEDGFEDRTGSWGDQGLCLVDWGKGIDLHLFPDDTEFEGDCRTSGFRCIQMQENKPWRFQAIAIFVRLTLIEKKATSDGGYIYLPKKPFKRYWNVDLWRELFSQLLNNSPHNDKLLQNLRERFQDYLCSNRQMLKKLKDLLAKQRLSMCSS
ncbi:hypothetical protein MANES_13G145916v8 [Manihot esculenta]|uniref:Uncharacterized protein n=1 Tax=Manihot esculenta TaxID=3983 RepID=A0ACB7GNQ3_MANES|nr:hypothetical protein MANES_13G145916v8 [Manihot esculenta]